MKKNEQNFHRFTQTYFAEIAHCLDSLSFEKIEKAVEIIIGAYRKNKKIFILGNGGSASTASHFACDLGKGTLRRIYDIKEKRLQVISLTDNTALITALANDVSYDDIFLQQLRNLVESEDVLIVFSGSGNSKNVIKAVDYAKAYGLTVIGFLGFKNGGKLAKLVSCPIIIDSNYYGPVEDIHLLLTHLMSSWIAIAKHTIDNNDSLAQLENHIV